MEPFLLSTLIAGLAEIGDRTQLLSFLLVCRYRRPFAILSGILLATLLCNLLAAGLGVWFSRFLIPSVLKWILGISFAAMAIWILIPEKPESADTLKVMQRSVFVTTLIGFCVAEMGDKTQFVTMALAARFDRMLPVIAGSTLGMMLANVPVVLGARYFGDKIGGSNAVRYFTAAILGAQAAASFAGYNLS